MECSAADAPTGAEGDRAPLRAAPPWVPAAQGSLCVTCRVRSQCLGDVAAEEGTTQLRGVLLGRRRLRAGEVVSCQDEPLRYLHLVRSGSLKSTSPQREAARVVGFHWPGEVAGCDPVASQRAAVTLTALEDTELCVVRYPANEGGDPGARAFHGRLWDMVSRELVRERALAGWLLALPPNRRLAAFLANAAARMRARGFAARDSRLHMSAADIASYLGVTLESVESSLSLFARRGLLESGPAFIQVLAPELLQREADAASRR
jgi:CRP/FNR family transcriptional regulator